MVVARLKKNRKSSLLSGENPRPPPHLPYASKNLASYIFEMDGFKAFVHAAPALVCATLTSLSTTMSGRCPPTCFVVGGISAADRASPVAGSVSYVLHGITSRPSVLQDLMKNGSLHGPSHRQLHEAKSAEPRCFGILFTHAGIVKAFQFRSVSFPYVHHQGWISTHSVGISEDTYNTDITGRALPVSPCIYKPASIVFIYSLNLIVYTNIVVPFCLSVFLAKQAYLWTNDAQRLLRPPEKEPPPM